MDHMDIDQIVEVPDTPDSFTKQGISGRSGVKVENHGSSSPRHGQQKFFEEGSRDQPMLIDGGSRGLSLHPTKHTNSPSNSRHPTTASFSLASSSSSRNGNLFRKGVAEKNPRYISNDSMPKPNVQSVRSPCMSKSSSSSSQSERFLDTTEMNSHIENASTNGVLESNQGDYLKKSGLASGTSQNERLLDLTKMNSRIGNASTSGLPGKNQGDFRKRSGLANSTCSHGLTNFPIPSCNASERSNNAYKVGSRIAFGEGVDLVEDGNKKPVNGGFLSIDHIASPRLNKQKRLVRNGCISPNNIAKAKQLAGKDINGSVAAVHNNGSMVTSSLPVSTDIRELVAEDFDPYTRKGKGMIHHSCSSKGPDLHNQNLHSRSFHSFNEKAMETVDYGRGASKSTEESGGWRSTRNKEHCLVRETDASRYSSQHHENMLERRGKGINAAGGDNYSKDPNLLSSEQVHTQHLRESASHPRARLGRLNGHCSTADTFIKRQKQGSTSHSWGECSTRVSDDPEVVFLSSSTQSDNPKSISSKVDNSQKIIKVDEISPQSRRDADVEDARARQVEADELLARELQEQLYYELPVFGVGEVDEHITLALQHQNVSNRGGSHTRRRVLDARSMANLHRQSQSRSSSNATRRGALARATLGRTTRRSPFPGQPRTLLPSRGRTSMFPPDMDVDMRMHILGALEEFNDMGLSSGILHADRDFNEDDYEMLLALDENTIQRGGASSHQINGLPQTTLQSDNFEEACAICLDTPTIGETIRHLPCLHKFHKDCIDPWLRRRTSCPVCKSSIT